MKNKVFDFGHRVPVNILVDLEREVTDVEIRQAMFDIDKIRHRDRMANFLISLRSLEILLGMIFSWLLRSSFILYVSLNSLTIR